MVLNNSNRTKINSKNHSSSSKDRSALILLVSFKAPSIPRPDSHLCNGRNNCSWFCLRGLCLQLEKRLGVCAGHPGRDMRFWCRHPEMLYPYSPPQGLLESTHRHNLKAPNTSWPMARTDVERAEICRGAFVWGFAWAV